MTQTIWYHGTHRAFLADILEEGLVGSVDDEHPHLVRVSLGDSPQWVGEWAQRLHEIDDENVVVLAVDVTGLPLVEDYDGPPAIAVQGDVPPERLSVVAWSPQP